MEYSCTRLSISCARLVQATTGCKQSATSPCDQQVSSLACTGRAFLMPLTEQSAPACNTSCTGHHSSLKHQLCRPHSGEEGLQALAQSAVSQQVRSFACTWRAFLMPLT